MSLLGAQLEEFQGGIFIPDEETLIYCVFPIFYTWQYYEICYNIVESSLWDDHIEKQLCHFLQNIAKGTTDPGVDCFDQ